MDLLYFESPPGLQFLHCVRNSATGGESVFVDSFRAATLVRANSDMLFRTLVNFPVTYRYRNDGQHYSFTRPHVVLDTYGGADRIAHVNWAPPFQGPFEIDIGRDGGVLRQYLSAVKQFASYLDDPASQFELKLSQGECVIFMNRRVLHSRRAFDQNSGERWLKGTYVDIDAFDSKYRTLSANNKHEEEYSYID
jgi:gamma-butyrobetaine dioxygenase